MTAPPPLPITDGSRGKNGSAGSGGICPPETQTYASNNFEGNFIGTIPPGMVETEIAAVEDAAEVLLARVL